MKFRNLVLALQTFLFAFAFVSCDKPQKSSKIEFVFDSNTSTLFGTATPARKRLQAAVGGTTGADGTDNSDGSSGGDWGLEDPTSFSEIQCFAAFVGANEPGLNESKCLLEDGNQFRFNPVLGLLSIGESGSLEVTPGPNRNIYIIGFSSADGSCAKGISNIDRFNYNYSAPQLIGQTTTTLAPGDNVVKVAISSQLGSSSKIKDCEFAGDSGRQETLEMALYESKRSLWVRDNPVPRTVTISHQGVSQECSRDNGVTYGSCGASFVWEIADYDKHHHIRVNYADGSFEEKSFRPSAHYPGLEYVDCDSSNSITASTTFDNAALQSLVGTAGQLVCLMDGVELTPASAPNDTLNLTMNGVTLLTPQGQHSEIKGAAAANAVTISNNQIRLYGLRLTSEASPTFDLISVSVSTMGLHIEDSEMIYSATSGSGTVLNAPDAGTSTEPIRIRNSKISYSMLSSEPAISITGTTFMIIEDSNIASSHKAFKVFEGAQLEVLNSKIKVESSSTNFAEIFTGSTSPGSILKVSGSILVDNSAQGLMIETDGAASNQSTLELSNNTLVRGTGNGANFRSFVIAASNAGLGEVINSMDANYFCNQDSSMAYFTNMTNGNSEAPSNWLDSNQRNTGPLATETCGSEIQNQIDSI